MIVIGKIKENYKDDNLPSIHDIINKPIKDKKIVLDYLEKGKVTSVSPSISRDLINKNNIIKKLYMMNDGIYAWRSDTIYYFEKYDIELQEDFIQHVLNKSTY